MSTRTSLLDATIAKGQLVGLDFSQADLAASQSDVQLAVGAVDNASDDQLQCTEYPAPFDGEIVAIGWALSAAGSAGNLSIGPTIGGTEQTALTAAVTTAANGYKRVPRGSIKFSAGQLIGAEITTDGSWNGTGADLIVTVYVLYFLEGI